tara:strand:- start:770 stop:1510 length:741 start_codon:yes stop_codon:yes gene_type:complete
VGQVKLRSGKIICQVFPIQDRRLGRRVRREVTGYQKVPTVDVKVARSTKAHHIKRTDRRTESDPAFRAGGVARCTGHGRQFEPYAGGIEPLKVTGDSVGKHGGRIAHERIGNQVSVGIKFISGCTCGKEAVAQLQGQDSGIVRDNRAVIDGLRLDRKLHGARNRHAVRYGDFDIRQKLKPVEVQVKVGYIRRITQCGLGPVQRRALIRRGIHLDRQLASDDFNLRQSERLSRRGEFHTRINNRRAA